MTTKQIPLILDGKFFEIIGSDSSGKVTAKCLTCSANIKGMFQPSSNFRTHLQFKHKDVLEQYKEYCKGPLNLLKQQRTLSFPVLSVQSTAKSRTEKLILDYIVQSMSPLSTVDNPFFVNLVKGLNGNATVLTSKTLKLRLFDEYGRRKNDIKHKLQNVKWISATADIWSAHRRSFLGVTCHWIHVDHTRKSAVLALKRFPGSHTGERIAEILIEIFNDYNVLSKVVSVTTDNAKNFIKAFKTDFQVESDEEDDVEDEILDVDLTAQLQEVGNDSLPVHFRCASHSLNLIATTDLESEFKSPIEGSGRDGTTFKKIMRNTFAKCSSFWNKNSRSPKAAEQVKEIILKSIITPVPTRWNSTFDSVEQLLSFSEDNLDNIFTVAGVSNLNGSEKQFLKDYCVALKPLSWALDKLQGEKSLFFGYVAPVIIKLDTKLGLVINEEGNSRNAVFYATTLQKCLHRRFQKILTFDTVLAKREILASILLPTFKLHFVSSKITRDKLKLFFINEAKNKKSIIKANEQVTPSNSQNCENPADLDSDDELLAYDPSSIKTSVASNDEIELECVKYLQDEDKTLTCLDKYTLINTMSNKYNVSLPSSAPVERLFSYGGMVLRPHRGAMSDDTFEKLVLLKLNNFD